jgi:hypothetical protein
MRTLVLLLTLIPALAMAQAAPPPPSEPPPPAPAGAPPPPPKKPAGRDQVYKWVDDKGVVH